MRCEQIRHGFDGVCEHAGFNNRRWKIGDQAVPLRLNKRIGNGFDGLNALCILSANGGGDGATVQAEGTEDLQVCLYSCSAAAI